MVGFDMGHIKKLGQANIYLMIKSDFNAQIQLMGLQSRTPYFNRILSLLMLDLLGQIWQYSWRCNRYLPRCVVFSCKSSLGNLVGPFNSGESAFVDGGD